MTKHTLSELQARFGLKPVKVSPDRFSDMPSMFAGFLKDGGKPAELEQEFGIFSGKVFAALAREGSFYLKPLMSTARDSFEASIVGVKGERDMERFRARLVSMCWCYENGDSVGNPRQLGDQMRADLVAELFVMCQKMNGMEADANAVEEAGKD